MLFNCYLVWTLIRSPKLKPSVSFEDFFRQWISYLGENIHSVLATDFLFSFCIYRYLEAGKWRIFFDRSTAKGCFYNNQLNRIDNQCVERFKMTNNINSNLKIFNQGQWGAFIHPHKNVPVCGTFYCIIAVVELQHFYLKILGIFQYDTRYIV